MTDVTALLIDDIEAFQGAGAFRRARAALGVGSFGMSIIDLPPNTTRYPNHDHRADGQEEVYVVLRGSGVLDVDGERLPLDPDRLVRVGPEVKRQVLPGDEGMRLLVLGGVPGRAYELPGPPR